MSFATSKNSTFKKQHIFWGIAGTVLLSGYFLKRTPLLKKLRQSSFQLELKHGTLTENTHSRLEPFIGTVILIPIQD